MKYQARNPQRMQNPQLAHMDSRSIESRFADIKDRKRKLEQQASQFCFEAFEHMMIKMHNIQEENRMLRSQIEDLRSQVQDIRKEFKQMQIEAIKTQQTNVTNNQHQNTNKHEETKMKDQNALEMPQNRNQEENINENQFKGRKIKRIKCKNKYQYKDENDEEDTLFANIEKQIYRKIGDEEEDVEDQNGYYKNSQDSIEDIKNRKLYYNYKPESNIILREDISKFKKDNEQMQEFMEVQLKSNFQNSVHWLQIKTQKTYILKYCGQLLKGLSQIKYISGNPMSIVVSVFQVKGRKLQKKLFKLQFKTKQKAKQFVEAVQKIIITLGQNHNVFEYKRNTGFENVRSIFDQIKDNKRIETTKPNPMAHIPTQQVPLIFNNSLFRN